ncbi:DUF3618 domain-containing protein [Nocardioides limicola]|uniref:DUF3618 domain-containing protein n=1 Tax=Nocardioides limicola TaxID=2803368 RepID=UPI0027DD22A5|nr:DUF3618 domain-containing protein [Nocardioides sp. DJM-14]
MTSEHDELKRDMAETRERLAANIDQLTVRLSPKEIGRRNVASVKGYFVEPVTGAPRTDNILKVAGGVLGVAAAFLVIRKVVRG